MSVTKTAPTSDPVAQQAEPANLTSTVWKAFEAAKLTPVRIDCQSYAIPGQPKQDMSCHSRLKADVPTFKRHLEGEHGGEYQFYLKRSETKAAPVWQELAVSGLEAVDFRCEICDQRLRFHPSSFTSHLKSHPGKTKSAYKELRLKEPEAIGVFNITLSYSKPELLDDSDFQ